MSVTPGDKAGKTPAVAVKTPAVSGETPALAGETPSPAGASPGSGWQRIASLPAQGVVFAIGLYQRGISPLLGRSCRFQPSCSAYMIGAVQKYGALRGVLKGLWRILRCHPFTRGGYDPP